MTTIICGGAILFGLGLYFLGKKLYECMTVEDNTISVIPSPDAVERMNDKYSKAAYKAFITPKEKSND